MTRQRSASKKTERKCARRIPQTKFPKEKSRAGSRRDFLQRKFLPRDPAEVFYERKFSRGTPQAFFPKENSSAGSRGENFQKKKHIVPTELQQFTCEKGNMRKNHASIHSKGSIFGYPSGFLRAPAGGLADQFPVFRGGNILWLCLAVATHP